MIRFGGNISTAFNWISSEVSNILETDSELDDLPSLKVVPLNEFESWQNYPNTNIDIPEIDTPETYNVGKFEINETLNSKIYFADCDICSLQVNAVICILDDALNINPLFKTLLNYGGSKFRESIAQLSQLSPGQSFSTICSNFPFKNIIFSISSRYSKKYHRSSCNTLNMSIRECIKLSIDTGCRTIAFELHPVSSEYFPIEHYAQTFLRSLRRWISIDPVSKELDKIFLVGSKTNLNIYLSLVPLYFPRRASEARPVEMGNNYGELEVLDRNIKITSGGNNLMAFDDPAFHSTTFNNSSKRRTRAEQVYYAKQSGDWEGNDEARFAYHSKIARSFNAKGHFETLKRLNFLSADEVDKMGRRIFWADIRKIPTSTDYAELVHFVLHSFEINGKFNLILVNCSSHASTPTIVSLFKDVFEIWGDRRLLQMSQLIIHQTGYLIKTLLFLLSPFLPAKIWDNTVYLEDYRELLEYVDSNVLTRLM